MTRSACCQLLRGGVRLKRCFFFYHDVYINITYNVMYQIHNFPDARATAVERQQQRQLEIPQDQQNHDHQKTSTLERKQNQQEQPSPRQETRQNQHHHQTEARQEAERILIDINKLEAEGEVMAPGGEGDGGGGRTASVREGQVKVYTLQRGVWTAPSIQTYLAYNLSGEEREVNTFTACYWIRQGC